MLQGRGGGGAQIQLSKEEWLLWLSLPASLYQRLSAGNRCLTSALPRLNTKPALFSVPFLYPGSLCENWTGRALLLRGGIYFVKVCSLHCATLSVDIYLPNPGRVCELWRSVLACVCVCAWKLTPPLSSNRSQVVCGDCKCFPMDFCGWPCLNRFWLDGITCFVIQRNNSAYTPSSLPSASLHKLLCFFCVLASMSSLWRCIMHTPRANHKQTCNIVIGLFYSHVNASGQSSSHSFIHSITQTLII